MISLSLLKFLWNAHRERVAGNVLLDCTAHNPFHPRHIKRKKLALRYTEPKNLENAYHGK